MIARGGDGDRDSSPLSTELHYGLLPKFALHADELALTSRCGQFWGRAVLAPVAFLKPGRFCLQVDAFSARISAFCA